VVKRIKKKKRGGDENREKEKYEGKKDVRSKGALKGRTPGGGAQVEERKEETENEKKKTRRRGGPKTNDK